VLGQYCGQPPNMCFSCEPIYLKCVGFLAHIDLRMRLTSGRFSRKDFAPTCGGTKMRTCISALINDRTPHKRFTANASAVSRTFGAWRPCRRAREASTPIIPAAHSLSIFCELYFLRKRSSRTTSPPAGLSSWASVVVFAGSALAATGTTAGAIAVCSPDRAASRVLSAAAFCSA
jgi:hypothetical protein